MTFSKELDLGATLGGKLGIAADTTWRYFKIGHSRHYMIEINDISLVSSSASRENDTFDFLFPMLCALINERKRVLHLLKQ